MNLDYWQAPGHVSARGMQSRPAVVHAVVETTGVETTGVRQKKKKNSWRIQHLENYPATSMEVSSWQYEQ